MIWALIDSSWLAYRALFGLGDLRGGDKDAPTGVLYGFFEQLRTVCQDPLVQTNKAAIFFDSRKSYRAVAYPLYKQKRKQQRTPEELALFHVMHEQMKLLRSEILPAVGFPVFRQTGLESDDLIALAARKLSDTGRGLKQAVIITADGDLYQCVSDSVHWYDPTRSQYVDPAAFFSRWLGIVPSQWAMVKAIAGCKSDNVKGVQGVGEPTAICYVLGMLPVERKRHEAITSADGKAIIARNLKLVQLPHEKTKDFKLKTPQYDADAFFRFCERYGMKSYLKGPKHREWGAFFRGDLLPREVRRVRRRGE